jgi:hypothetical protein
MAEFEKNFRRKSQVVLSYLCIVNALTYMVTTKIYSALLGQCILGLALTQLGKKSMFELTSHAGISTTYYKARKDFEKLEKENPIPDDLAAFAGCNKSVKEQIEHIMANLESSRREDGNMMKYVMKVTMIYWMNPSDLYFFLLPTILFMMMNNTRIVITVLLVKTVNMMNVTFK